MTNIDDILASIAPETNSIDEFDRLIARSRAEAARAGHPTLTRDDLQRIVDRTMPLGRYGAQVRNCLRTYYSI